MKIQCPHCGQRYEIDDQYDGFQTECLRCRKSFVITSINVGDEEISGSRQKKDTRGYTLPPIAMLDKADNIYDESPEEIHDLQEAIEQTLASFKLFFSALPPSSWFLAIVISGQSAFRKPKHNGQPSES